MKKKHSISNAAAKFFAEGRSFDVCLAFAVCIPAMYYTITRSLDVEISFSQLYGILIFLFLLSIITCRRKTIRLKLSVVLFYAYLLLAIVFTIMFVDGNHFDTVSIAYIFLPLAICVMPLDSRYVLESISVTSIIIFPFFLFGYVDGSFSSSQEMQPIGYALLPLAFSGFGLAHGEVHPIVKTASLIVSIATILILAVSGTRGPLVSILIYIGYISIAKRDLDFNVQVKFEVLTLIIIAALIVIISFEPLVKLLAIVLPSLGIDSDALNKTIRLLNENNLDNGRNYLYSAAINDFYRSPIFGNGLATFTYMNYTYPHNLFLQLLCEGGLVLAIPVVCWLLRGLYHVFSKCDWHDYSLFGLLFAASVPNLMFSSSIWLTGSLWILLAWISCHLFTQDNQVALRSGNERLFSIQRPGQIDRSKEEARSSSKRIGLME